MSQKVATFNADTGAITGFYDLSLSSYETVDLSSAIVVPDDIWQNHLGKPLIVKNGVITVVEPVAPTLVDLVATAKSNLASIRYTHEIAGVSFTLTDGTTVCTVASDRESQSKLIAAYVLASSTPSRWKDGNRWKMLDGSFVALNAQEAVVMSLTVQGYVSSCFDHESDLSAQIDAATDEASLNAIDLNQGWP